MLSRRSLFACALALSLPACRDAIDAKPEPPSERLALPSDGIVPAQMRIGVTPHSGQDTAAELEPLLTYLASKLPQLSFVTEVAADYDGLAKMLHDKRVEVGVFSPLSYVEARGPLPAVEIATATKRGSPTYVGYLVVKRSPDMSQRPGLESLRGKRIAYVHTSSTSGYLYPRALLRSRGLEPDTFFAPKPRFAGDHKKALRLLWDDQVDVAAVASAFADPGPLNALSSGDDDIDAKEVIANLVVVAKTRRIPLDAVVIRNDISRETGVQLQNALLQLHDNVSAARQLQGAWGMNGFVSPKLHDGKSRYDGIAEVWKKENAGN
jgi:phosphate/phosphite/phosphonate ABC transporter binding protein